MNKPQRDWLFPASRAEECLERDLVLALALLEGLPKRDPGKHLLKWLPLSARTEPTEKEAREALGRVLLSIAAECPPEDGRRRVLQCLMSVFMPWLDPPFPILPPSPFKAVLKRRNQGHADPWHDLAIAMIMQTRMTGGLSYDDAAAGVAESFGYDDTRHVKTIYGRWKPHLDESGVIRYRTGGMMPDR